jgi:tmRNA-binding protein
MELPQINESHANFSENFVEIKGNEIDLEKVKASVEKAGYKYKQVMP